MTTKKFLTAEEVIEFYGVDEAVLQDLVKDGSLKALADRGTWKFRRDDIDALIRAKMLHPTKELPVVGDEIAVDMITFADEGDSSSAVDYIELDEDAMAEQPTMITSGSPGGLFPKLADEPTGDDSSSEVHVVLEPMESDSSDSDIRLGRPAAAPLSDEISDSDVKTLSNLAAPPSALSGDTSDSDVKTISSYEIAAAKSDEVSDSDVKTLSAFDMPAAGADDANVLTDESASVFDMAAADSGITLDSPTGHDQTQEIEIEEDDDVGLPVRSSEQTMEMKATGSSFDIASDSALKLDESSVTTGDSSMLLDEPGSSVIDFDDEDSGISLDTGDSGISLDTGDSGISLDAGDSGISLDAGDSGISLSAGDSGISLEADSGLQLDPKSGKIKNLQKLQKTESMFQLKGDDDFQLAGTGATQPSLPVDDDMEATAAFHLDQGDSANMPTLAGLSDDEIPTKGRKIDPLGFSGAIAAGATIEGLEVVDELDTMFPEEDADEVGVLDAIDDEEVEELEASDESFAEFAEAPEEDEFGSETYEAPSVATKEPKERGWGAFATLSVLSASVLMGVNAWILWEGIATMWTGAQPSAPAAAIISSLAGLF